MVIAAEKFESLLIDAIETKNEYQFTYILNDLKVNPEQKQKCLKNLSIFEKVLKTPASKNFIEMCIKKGCHLYQKNCQEIFPLQYVIDSQDAENLKTFLKSFEQRQKNDATNAFAINKAFQSSSLNLYPGDEKKITIDEEEEIEQKPEIRRSMMRNEISTPVSRSQYFDKVLKLQIVNETFDGGNNYLHVLIDQLSEENYCEVSEMIKLMLKSKCNPNLPNDQLETPFYTLLKKLRDLKVTSDLVEFFLNNAHVDFFSYHSDEIIKLMDECDLRNKIVTRKKSLFDLLEDWNERKFVDEFDAFYVARRHEVAFKNDLGKLLEAAVARNFKEAVRLLLDHDVDVNGIPEGSKFNVAPSFIACSFGHHEVLKILLSQPSTRFKSDKQSVLQQICLPGKIHPKDRQRCFDLIITDPRCTVEIINNKDEQGLVPLFYACHHRFDEIAKELLRRGAFIGHDSVIENINKGVLREFLDECIKCTNDIEDQNCTIHIDYRFLTPNGDLHDKRLEVQPIHMMASNPKLIDLILHPAISLFLHIKWRKINWLVYFNMLAYFSFMLFLGVFMISFFHDHKYAVMSETKMNRTSPRLCSDSSQSAPDLGNDSDTDYSYTDDSFENETDYEFVGSKNISYVSDNGGAYRGIHPLRSSKTMLLMSILGRRKRDTSDVDSTAQGLDETEDQDIHADNDDVVNKDSRRKKRAEELDAHLEEHVNAYLFCIAGVFLMIIYELVQFAFSYREYFFKVSNWLDIALVSLSVAVLIFNRRIWPEYFKKIRAITVLMMAAQSIQLIAKVSFLSMSLHMAIFERVCKTFLKTVALYMILILAFAMSFYTLNYHGEDLDERVEKTQKSIANETVAAGAENASKKGFSNVFISIISIIRMMLSDFDSIEMDPKDHFQGFMFLLFMVLISVVLFNLLNALAITDTHKIMLEAELVNTKKRISNLRAYEKIFATLKLSFANIFPKYSRIALTPNINNEIAFESINDDCNYKIESKAYSIDAGIKFLQSRVTSVTMDEIIVKNIVDFSKSFEFNRE